MSDLQLRMLQAVEANNGKIENSDAVFQDIESQILQAALNSLVAKSMITFSIIEKESWKLTSEGEEVVSEGSHEFRLLAEVTKHLEGLDISKVSKVLGPAGKLGQGKAFKNGWIKKDGDVLLSNVTDLPEDSAAGLLKSIKENGILDDKKELADLKKRKLKGVEFALTIVQVETDITSDMLANGKWKTATFKPYNFNSEGVAPHSGALHPLNKVREEFRQILLSMGFTEMPSNQYVETGFWNFDTLYLPQQHPARDLQDTFYLKDTLTSKKPEDETYWNNIKKVHQEGAFGSIGYRYPWKEDESLRMVLRTHTTVISAAMLHQLAKDPKPARLFSIDRVFRYEAVDATHLAEFHHVEGVLADYNLTLGDLITFMKSFYGKMGVKNLAFKPTYNQYTEPSLEIYSWHEGLGRLLEIGNSGMFRPEMLESMGLPKDLRVLGWGFSLERPTMIKYGCNNIRELLGHRVTLDFIETNPAARLEVD
ncbi:hypothetical protein BABINDRAFT_15266 [Babjeviella inositovora NRRL Y-12698]|uniref:phenylalanine--tRNA ligase n=1 Tax=Babjeviella inositovora NRRL Y-12698 TaxID=984486 RepID=A0A1E3QJR7_9ASCO|nr:uncharacterized protein BABINDRAFT_15266 [Babjeviella inositovora NRRL Y-12698]ODQ77929.1 hypothetical protein BABINDRAFT_15266 [Babjeviella inositovora NRRL Y-12698]